MRAEGLEVNALKGFGIFVLFGLAAMPRKPAEGFGDAENEVFRLA